MLPHGLRQSILCLIVCLMTAGTSAVWALDPQDGKNKADGLVEPFVKRVDELRNGPVASLSNKKPLSSIGRPASQGPSFPESPAPSQEAWEKLEARVHALIPQLGDARSETRDKAMRELQTIGYYARASLERAVAHENKEISDRAAIVLGQFPKHTHSIVDAIGDPIPFAKITITLKARPNPAGNVHSVTEKGPKTDAKPVDVEAHVVGDWSDEFGRISVPECEERDIVCVMNVDHPDYGRGRCDVPLWTLPAPLKLPLVRRGSELRGRAIRGVVVDPRGQPVAGAMIHCDHVRTPGEGLINGAMFRGDALTDTAGQFCFYLPNQNPDRKRGDIIPPNSRYETLITQPDDESFFPVSASLSNTSPVRVEMPRPTLFHRFQFQSLTGGWLERAEQIQNLHVSRREGNQQAVRIDAGSLIRGRRILKGIYTAVYYDNGKVVPFEPLTVDEQSPEEMIFRVPKAITYRGRVIDGVTGAAVPNAIVIGWQSTSRNNLALLSDDEWTLLEATPSNPASNDPAIQFLKNFYGVQGFVRTDNEGRFEIVRSPGQDYYGLLAFQRNSVPFKVRVGSLTPDSEQKIETGDFPLFPAAKVIVRPVFDGNRPSIMPQWLPTPDDQPGWFGRLQEIKSGSDRDVEYVHWMTVNEAQPIYVPAGIRLRLRFETPYNDEWAPAVTQQPIQSDVGTSTDLGEIVLAASLPVYVLVTDQAGKPVEGFAVRRKYVSENVWSVAHNTDERGKAFFHVHPNSEGEFRVSEMHRPFELSKDPNLSLSFETNERAPKEPYRIKLTEEQIASQRATKKP